MQQGLLAKSFKFVFIEIIGNILYFPVWWYGPGLLKSLKKMGHRISYGNQVLALGVWVKNFFVPMYGQREWEGILVSIFVRFFMIIIKAVLMIIWIIWSLILFLAWVLLPLIILIEIIFNLGWI